MVFVCDHRLTYSHSWGRTHKCIVQIRIRMLLKVFVFCFFFKNKIIFFTLHPRLPLHRVRDASSTPPPPSYMTPTSSPPLYLVLGMKIRVSIENPNFSQNPNCNHISSSQPTNSGFCRNPNYLIVSELIPPNLLRILHGIAYWFIRNTILIVN